MEGWIVFISISIVLLFGGCFIGFVGVVENSNKAFGVGLVMIVIGAILFGLFMFAQVKCEKQAWKREDPYVIHTIIALSDGNEIDGKIHSSRYCMSGYINEKFTYVYGYQTANGGMKIQKAGADSTVVYFRDDIEPCAKWYKETRSFWWCTQTRYTCEIFVPTDSLEASITIDLE